MASVAGAVPLPGIVTVTVTSIDVVELAVSMADVPAVLAGCSPSLLTHAVALWENAAVRICQSAFCRYLEHL